ncbi:TPA: hypothetical protein JAN90_11715 [Legionella pneumophila]|uniref:hypothetical protein n=1 Tax=Legionella sp. PATHC039 TaxID=2992042 RepID=UPI0007782D05|nr:MULTISPECIES: hypothetical protein [Legionella]HAT8859435.1 hypothetical protein [Legionella pneumophila subsp. pneumophila]MCW8396282.1 hypothetical protein [Legionella sp. PATHC039]HAT7073411.1 hypothetical protein [Legionella pneumophila]HAT8642848.1 hypothetical protein [Legionella pneumophila]HAT8869274.1 hypothetical protein [Legionella pneumophila subsp. pneumophila]
MRNNHLLLLLKEIMEDIKEAIRTEEEIERENSIRDKLSNPKSLEEYMKNLELLQMKLNALINRIDQIKNKVK